MANTRIRYDEVGNVLSSRRLFITNRGREVKVIIDKGTNSYEIVDSVTGDIVMSAANVSVNLSVTKIKAKEALESLGVLFENEERNRSAAVGTEATTETQG